MIADPTTTEIVSDARRVPKGNPQRLLLAAICVTFAAARLPVLLRQIPAQDEDYFAVPGLTILREGIPRIPYLPSRNPDGAFYRADEALFALPPLYFYLEAPIYALVGPGTAAARLVSMLCGIASIVMVYVLARRLFARGDAALWSAGFYAASRVLYFPCVIARPDMLCGAIGLATLLAMLQWWTLRRLRWLLLAGLLIGLGMLSHPFALVYAIQSGFWSLLASGPPLQRFSRTALLTLIAIATFSIWGVLIVQHPDVFRTQFFNNVLGQTGPGLASRMVAPFPSFAAQWPLFIEHVGPIQATLMTAGGIAAVVLALRYSSRAVWRLPAVLAISGVFLHVVSIGSHPTKGYWCFTGALLFLCLGGCLDAVLTRFRYSGPSGRAGMPPFRRPRLPYAVSIVIATALMAPGSGVRTLVTHLQHWNDINYDAPRFTRELIAAVPPDAAVVVDTAYVFAFYCAGRAPVLARTDPFYFDVRGAQYDYIVAGPYSLRDEVPQALDGRFLRVFGARDDLFACYAELYDAGEGD